MTRRKKITRAEYARRRGVSAPAVTKAVKTGRISVGADGLLDPEVADREWAENTGKRADVPTPATGDGILYHVERARLTKAQADRAELEAKELAGELVAIAVVLEEWARLVGGAKQKFLGFPAKLAPRIRATTSDEEAARLLEAEIVEILTELADSDGLPDRTTRSRRRRVASVASSSPT